MVLLEWHDIIAYAACGVATGFLSGLLGVGGGIIIVPSLVALFAWDNFPLDKVFHFAAGTSFAVMMLTTSRALHGHAKRVDNLKRIFMTLCYAVIIGAVCGAVVAHFLHPSILKWLFAAVMVVVALKLFFAPKLQELSQDKALTSHPIAGFCIGFLSSMLGIGGSTFTVPFLVSLQVPLRTAIAVATAVGVAISVCGVILYSILGLFDAYHFAWSAGYIYLPAAIVMSAFCFLTIPLGIKCSYHLPVSLLQKLFAAFVLIVAVHMIFS